LTNRKNASTKKILPAASFLEKHGGTVKVVFPSDTAAIPSLKIDLGSALKD
jgi:hypothetical protein